MNSSPYSQAGTARSGANAFLAPTSRTAELYAEACRYLVGGTSRLHYHFAPYPIYARSGAGCYLTDVEGVERLDFLNNMTALVHGHAHPRINQALIEQLQRGTAFSEPAEPEVQLAKLMVERVKSVERIRFANSGTEAVMLALKLARAFTGRSRIAKFEGFYHGYYDYVQVSYASTPQDWGPAETPSTVPSSGGLSDAVCAEVLTLPYNDRPAVERLLAQHGPALAAVIVDPFCQRSGFPQPRDGFLQFLRQITRAYGILLVYDEVISFRLGYHGAQGVYGGDPDLTAFGKIIGGGLPIGAVGGRADVMALLDPARPGLRVASGGTFSANPLSMTAGLAAMEQMTPAAFTRLNALGERLRNQANTVFTAVGVPGQLSGGGSLFLVTLTPGPIVNYRSLARGPQVDEGIIISRDGLGCLSTPMAEAEVDAFVSALERALVRVKQEEGMERMRLTTTREHASLATRSWDEERGA
jgi:glutamate-1-semialdehyde 2,1-aminomutase